MTTTIHLLCGSTGAGKTTYGRVFAEEIGAVFFSVDSWMSALFWMDAPQPIEPAWAMARVDRCVALIWRTAVALARRGTPAMLEIGLTTRAARDRVAKEAARDAVPLTLHLLDASPDERWRRVQARNEAPGNDAQLAFAISRAQFDFVEAMWEPPTPEELSALNGVRVA